MYLSVSAQGLLRHSCRDQGSVLLLVWPQVTSLLSCLTAARWWPTGAHWYLGFSICFICFCACSVSALGEKWSWQVCVLLGILNMKIASAAVKPIEIISCMSLFELTFSLKQDCSLCGSSDIDARSATAELPALLHQLLAVFWQGSVLPPHLCRAGSGWEQGTIALLRALTHFQVMQVPKALLIQWDEFPFRRGWGQTKHFIGDKFGDQQQSVS